MLSFKIRLNIVYNKKTELHTFCFFYMNLNQVENITPREV